METGGGLGVVKKLLGTGGAQWGDVKAQGRYDDHYHCRRRQGIGGEAAGADAAGRQNDHLALYIKSTV